MAVLYLSGAGNPPFATFAVIQFTEKPRRNPPGLFDLERITAHRTSGSRTGAETVADLDSTLRYLSRQPRQPESTQSQGKRACQSFECCRRRPLVVAGNYHPPGSVPSTCSRLSLTRTHSLRLQQTQRMISTSTSTLSPTLSASASPIPPTSPPSPLGSDENPSQDQQPKLTQAERDQKALEAFEDRFGGAETTQLGVSVDGKPDGLARSVKKNMFRVIG